MKLSTKYHGELEIQENQYFTFEEGIPGFSQEKKFVLLDLTDDQSFSVLQSTQTPGLAFVVTSPFLTYPEYEFQLDDQLVEQMGITKEGVVIYSIVTVKDPFAESSINLQAPVMMDMNTRKAKQIILNQTNYQIRTPLFPKVENKEE